MARAIAQGDGWVEYEDGSISVRQDVLESALKGDSDDNESFEGEEDNTSDSPEFGADKKKKPGLLDRIFGNKGKNNGKSGSKSGSSSKTTTINLTGGGLPPQMDPNSSYWDVEMLDGDATAESAGDVKITIRVQEDFWADSVLCNGSTTGAVIKRIKFGPRNVYEANGSGADVSLFQAVNPIMSNILKGRFIRAGLDITIEGTLPGAGSLKVLFQGRRKKGSSC